MRHSTPSVHDHFDFKQLDYAGLQTLIGWAEQEGWNPGQSDAEAFWSADPEGYYGYFHDDELIAGGSIVTYGGEFGFMGLFIVHPRYRSQGIGRKLWFHRRDTLRRRLKEGAPIGMDGVLEMQPFYAKGGFQIAFRDERYACIGSNLETDPQISPIGPDDHGVILEYDRVCFGFQRPRFLIPWLDMPMAKTFKFVDRRQLRGFAVIRKAVTGHKIGPLFAESPQVAEALYRACLNVAPGEPVFIDIPMVNQAALALVQSYQASFVFECARMYLGKPPTLPMDKIFGITTFELG